MSLVNPDSALMPVVYSNLQFLMRIMLPRFLQASQTTKQLPSQSTSWHPTSHCATHIIDRNLRMPEIKSHLQEITGDNLTYVLDTVDHGFHARSVYSLIDEMWESSYLVKGNIDEMVIVEKKAGYKVEMTFGSSQLHGDFTRSFW